MDAHRRTEPCALTQPSQRRSRLPLHAVRWLLAATVLTAACDDPTVLYLPDRAAATLQLRDDQRAAADPYLLSIQQELVQFYTQWSRLAGEARQGGMEVDQESLAAERRVTLGRIAAILDTLAGRLSADQAGRLRAIPLPELNQQERARVAHYILRAQRAERQDVVFVHPTLQPTDLPAPLPPAAEVRRQWTVYLGLFVPYAALAPGQFPLSVRATLMDPAVRAAADSTGRATEQLFQQATFEIQVTARTAFHPSYLDLTEWIIFVENSAQERLEPLRIERRDHPWDPPERLTALLFPSDVGPGRGIGFGTPPDGGGPPGPTEGPVSPAAASYSLIFPGQYDGRPFISAATAFVSLVMTREVGSTERAEGRWQFHAEESPAP